MCLSWSLVFQVSSEVSDFVIYMSTYIIHITLLLFEDNSSSKCTLILIKPSCACACKCPFPNISIGGLLFKAASNMQTL